MSNIYDPPTDLCALGAVLSGNVMPELLFRFPGPCGLFDLSHGIMDRLAPPELSYTYFGAQEHLEFSAGIRQFGSLAVFRPVSFQVVRLVDDEVLSALGFTAADRENVFLGINRPVTDSDFAWVPTETYFGSTGLTTCRSADDVRQLVGAQYDELRNEMFHSVRSYMEEMTEVLRTGVPRPPGSWYALPVEERRKFLEANEIKPLWS